MLPKKLRISLVSDITLDADLHKTRELEILKALADRGHITTMVAVTSRRSFQVRDSRINLISVPIRRWPLISHVVYTLFLFLFLPLHILRKKPDLVVMDPHISALSSIPSLLFLRFPRTKFVLDIKSTPVEVKGASAKLAAFFFNVLVAVAKKLFHAIEVVTPMMKVEICGKFGVDPRNVLVWTNGVPLKLFDPQNSLPESMKLRKQLGLTEKFVVFYHGVFSASRGLTETIDAINIVRRRHPEVVFFLLGTGPIVSHIEDLIQQKNLQNNVVLHAPVPYEDVPKFIGLSDVCIVPLLSNSYWSFQSPLKLLEYLAMEKVVLLTDIPAHRSVTKNEQCCIYLQSTHPVEIAKSIEHVYINKTKLGEWGKVGRNIVKSDYTWDRVAEEVETSFYRLNAIDD